MVINSTRMKLNDPREREKRMAASVTASGSNTIAMHHNTDINFHFRKKHSQKISVEVMNKGQQDRLQPDSEGTVHVDANQHEELSQLPSGRQASYHFGARTAKAGAFQNRNHYVERVKKISDQYAQRFQREPDKFESLRSSQDKLLNDVMQTAKENEEILLKNVPFSKRQAIRNQGIQMN